MMSGTLLVDVLPSHRRVYCVLAQVRGQVALRCPDQIGQSDPWTVKEDPAHVGVARLLDKRPRCQVEGV